MLLKRNVKSCGGCKCHVSDGSKSLIVAQPVPWDVSTRRMALASMCRKFKLLAPFGLLKNNATIGLTTWDRFFFPKHAKQYLGSYLSRKELLTGSAPPS